MKSERQQRSLWGEKSKQDSWVTFHKIVWGGAILSGFWVVFSPFSSPFFLITPICHSCPLSEQSWREQALGSEKARTYFLLQFTPFPGKFLRNPSNWWTMFIGLLKLSLGWSEKLLYILPASCYWCCVWKGPFRAYVEEVSIDHCSQVLKMSLF